jgi:hypothetical protein
VLVRAAGHAAAQGIPREDGDADRIAELVADSAGDRAPLSQREGEIFRWLAGGDRDGRTALAKEGGSVLNRRVAAGPADDQVLAWLDAGEAKTAGVVGDVGIRTIRTALGDLDGSARDRTSGHVEHRAADLDAGSRLLWLASLRERAIAQHEERQRHGRQVPGCHRSSTVRFLTTSVPGVTVIRAA